uniref:Uncharacterized protein n=1 Tax=Triticum urartu TaxID=4572 RepID=A0A8R7Q9Q8_TRIUA
MDKKGSEEERKENLPSRCRKGGRRLPGRRLQQIQRCIPWRRRLSQPSQKKHRRRSCSAE